MALNRDVSQQIRQRNSVDMASVARTVEYVFSYAAFSEPAELYSVRLAVLNLALLIMLAINSDLLSQERRNRALQQRALSLYQGRRAWVSGCPRTPRPKRQREKRRNLGKIFKN